MTDRLGLSNSAAVAIVSCVIKAGGGDLGDFDMSISTARRNREKQHDTENQRFYSQFEPPSMLSWDGMEKWSSPGAFLVRIRTLNILQ